MERWVNKCGTTKLLIFILFQFQCDVHVFCCDNTVSCDRYGLFFSGEVSAFFMELFSWEDAISLGLNLFITVICVGNVCYYKLTCSHFLSSSPLPHPLPHPLLPSLLLLSLPPPSLSPLLPPPSSLSLPSPLRSFCTPLMLPLSQSVCWFFSLSSTLSSTSSPPSPSSLPPCPLQRT